jgi:hypothetical protein
MTFRVAAALLVAVLAVASTAAAQGRGNAGRKGVPPGLQRSSTRTGAETAAAPVGLQPSPSFPQFGTWLDDASTAAKGMGFASIGATYWRGTGANQIDAPILGVTYGVASRTQLSATVPFYRARYEGFSGSGLDNVYISGKISVVDPNAGAGRFGVAVGGVAEILSAGFADASRVHFAVPLSVELRGGPVRLYGSTGYFSRGAVFGAAALEWTAPTGTSFTGSLAHSQSVHGVTVATTASVPRASSRDVSVFVSHPVSSIASVYVGGSRTFSDTWIGGASAVSGGISFRFANPPTSSGQVSP